MSMANAGPGTNGSQCALCLSSHPSISANPIRDTYSTDGGHSTLFESLDRPPGDDDD